MTIPANQLKQLGVGTGSGGLQTILMPVGKGKVSFVTKKDNVCILDRKPGCSPLKYESVLKVDTSSNSDI